ncbi:hypothetical protein QBC32DRAFT_216603, partial [Pseudoneurospora amorphoporcata]
SATSTSTTQRTTPSSKRQKMFTPTTIYVQLTERDRLLSPQQVEMWRFFWDSFLPPFNGYTTYRLIIPPNPELWGPWSSSDPFLELGPSLMGPFAFEWEAQLKTLAAVRILKSLGFVDVTRPGMSYILMKWGYPDREVLRRTIPGLVEGLGIICDNCIPDHRWLRYIQWQ